MLGEPIVITAKRPNGSTMWIATTGDPNEIYRIIRDQHFNEGGEIKGPYRITIDMPGEG